MPFGPWRDLDDCLSDPQMRRRHPDLEARRRVCGALKRRLGGELAEAEIFQVEREPGLRAEVNFSYLASFEPYEAQGRRFVKVFVIEPGVVVHGSPNPWGVTREAALKALPTLIGKPLVAGHDASRPLGRFVAYEADGADGAIYGIAEVTDEGAWERIRSGELRYVSPEVRALVARRQDGADVLEAFEFRHVAFVEQPAFGRQAQVRGLCEGVESPRQCTFAAELSRALSALSALNGGESSGERLAQPRYPWEQCIRDRLRDGYSTEQARRICAAIKNRTVRRGIESRWWRSSEEGIRAIARKIDEDPIYAYTLDRLYEISSEPPAFSGSSQSPNRDVVAGGGHSDPAAPPRRGCGEGHRGESGERIPGGVNLENERRLAELEAAVKTLKAELEAKNAVIEDLHRKLDAYEAERRRAKVDEVLNLRLKAGLVEERGRDAEAERLSKFSAETLDAMKADLQRLASRFERPEASNAPKAKFTAEQAKGAEDAVRERLYGTTRHLWEK